MDLNLATLHQGIAQRVPDREGIVWREQRKTWAEVAERARRFANLLIAHGMGVHGDPATVQPWESPHDHVALYMYNCPEFLEALLGTHLARVAPFNVNYRYVADELQTLLAGARPRVIVVHARLAPTLAAVLPQLPEDLLVIQVADDSGEPLLPGALDFEAALATASAAMPSTAPSADDLHVVFTGGTTGLPKGVLWRIGDLLAGPLGHTRRDGSEWESYEEAIDFAAGRPGLRTLPAPPFIHGAGLWVAMGALITGGTVVIQDDPIHFDGAALAALCERERVGLLSLVGDAMAVPFLDALDRAPHQLAVKFVHNTAAPLSERTKARLLDRLPALRIVDGLGSSETGHLGARTTEPNFALSPGSVVLSEDLTRELTPGEDEVGWLCTALRHARGYLDDEVKTKETFTTYQGRSLVISGDRVRLCADGRFELLGRDSLVINTGGEKVFAEEVENGLRRVDGIADAAVLGRPHHRWGHEVVAVIALRRGATLDDATVLDAIGEHLAGYKLPRAIFRAPAIQRAPNGKLDYRWARAYVAESATR
ncbi:MAG TPA: AMP-binding protein [Mycobacteriales bacterium]|nr:AMP-binding protein [Mycobacteriales bacterium]